MERIEKDFKVRGQSLKSSGHIARAYIPALWRRVSLVSRKKFVAFVASMFCCSFSIDEDSDPDRRFSVNSYGFITTAKMLDRETEREHRIHVLATDKGQLVL